MAGENNVQDVPKWKIALAVGTPVAIGIAIAWYYKNKPSEPGDSPEEHPTMVDPDRTDVESIMSETSVLTEFVKVWMLRILLFHHFVISNFLSRSNH